jgi:hypothetical protein
MSPYHARLAVFFTSVILAFVAGSLTMLSAAAARRPSPSAKGQAMSIATPNDTLQAAPGELDLYLPALDPNADQCQG